SGKINLRIVESGTEPLSLGRVFIRVTRDSDTVTAEGPEILLLPEDYSLLARVKTDYTHVKNSPSSSFYDEFTPASAGMTDRVVSCIGGYCKLAIGKYVALENVELLYGEPLPEAELKRIGITSDEKATVFSLELGAAPHYNLSVKGTAVSVTVIGAASSASSGVSLPENDRLFRSFSVRSSGEDLLLSLQLRSSKNYYGMNASYEDGKLLLSFRQPQALSDSQKPLTGKTVVLDAGHGGSDSGALGFLSGRNEEDLNLAITLKLAEKMESLGATVVLSRRDDVTVSLYERMDLLTATDPDLSISIHHNSVAETKNPNNAKGTWGLYWSESGISLTDYVHESVALELGFYDYGTQQQKLALCRNHRFPQTLVEVGFICSPSEFQIALRSDYDDRVADAIAEGVLDWYRMQEAYLAKEL
ncbi:MAG: N-acetylmuramoyl-L-alanine amidase, partial [Clostridia bacterium]|nr:N-acetylmuramoyl-L-alanine amidase [Clostridia bacterium]